MIRSTKHYLTHSNLNKRNVINDFLLDYKFVTQQYINYIWSNTFTNQNNEICWDIKNDKLYLPKYLDYKVVSHDKLSARALSAALTQAIGIVKGSTAIRNKTLYVIKKRKEENKSTDYWEKKLKKLSKPILKNNFKAELSSKQVEFRNESNNEQIGGFMKIGYYSAYGDSLSGHCIYSTPDGLRIKITEVITKENQKPMSRFNDLVYVGPVDKFLKSMIHIYDVSTNDAIQTQLDKCKKFIAEQTKCAAQFKTTKKCFCYLCPIDRSN